MPIGKCLCGAVSFEVLEPLPNLYQCHCSLCRKVSGSASNSAMIVLQENFLWIAGSNKISTYSTSTGFRSHFCSSCGSPLPNEYDGGLRYWVPVGLFDSAIQASVCAHLYVNSKADWDNIAEGGTHYDEMPTTSLMDIIRSN